MSIQQPVIGEKYIPVTVTTSGLMLRPETSPDNTTPLIFQFPGGNINRGYKRLLQRFSRNNTKHGNLFLRALRDSLAQDYDHVMNDHLHTTKTTTTVSTKKLAASLAQQEPVFDPKNSIEQIIQLYFALCVVLSK